MAFTRTIEDFTCEHCGAEIKGTGYTNHCTKCLWSKHVDIIPGDRMAPCGGMMRPVRVEGATPDYMLVQECEKCNHWRRNRLAPNDEFDAVLALIKNIAAH